MGTHVIPVSTQRANPTVVIRGTGPAMHVKTSGETKLILITKSRARTVKLDGSTDINFAA